MLSLFAKLKNKYFQQFIRLWGREPQSAKEWMTIQDNAVRELNKTKGVPGGPKKPPFQGWKPEVIQGGKGIESLLESGAVKKGVAPKTKLSTLEGKKQKLDKAINKEEWIAKKQRENKEAVERFRKRTQKKTVEDFRDEGDWDPGGMASGGRIGMMYGGDPGFAFEYGGSWADWHDQHRDQMPVEQYIKTKLPKHRLPFREMQSGGRAGYDKGGLSSPRFNHPDKRQGILGSGVTWTDLMEDLHPFMYSPGMIERTKRDIIDPIFKKKLKWDELDEYYKQLEMDEDMREPENVPRRGEQYAASGGIAQLSRPGYFFGGPAKGSKALKAIMDAWRANKTWGVGGPPFRPEKTSFDF